MSSTGTEPLLSERCFGHLAPSKVNLFNFTQKDYYIVDGHIWKDEVDDAPLNQRGWVFQERYLARRILHFGPRQLAWECLESEALEVFPDGLHEFFNLTSTSKPRAYESLRQSPPERNEASIREFSEEYRALVQNYSKCNLTRLEDKLIAFSGIPRAIQQNREDHYAAGVWNSSLPFNLNWYRDHIGEESSPTHGAPFRAPSWSWASVFGEVTFPSYSGAAKEIFVADWKFVQSEEFENDPFVDRTLIKLNGIVLPVEIEWSEGVISVFRISMLEFEHDIVTPDRPSMDLDGPDEDAQSLVQNGNAYSVPLFATENEIHCILVSKVSGSLGFARLGRIQVPLLRRFQEVEAGGAQDLDRNDVRVTRNGRRLSDKGTNESVREDPMGQKLTNVIRSEKPLAITLV